jgi:hypothetical protein
MWLVFVLCLSSSTLSAQENSGATVPSPEKIRETLLDKSSELIDIDAREKLAADLRLVTVPESAEQHETTCADFDSVRLSYPALEPGFTDSTLIFRSEHCWWDFVVILRHTTSAAWTHVATYPVFSKYDHSAVRFPSLLKQGQQEIMIDRTNIISGTGFWQYNTTVIRMNRGRPEVILDESQESNLSVPDGKGSNTELLERGIFFVVPSEEPEKALCDSLEKQEISKHSQRIVRWRIFAWDSTMSRFRPQFVDESYANKLSKKSVLTSSGPR